MLARMPTPLTADQRRLVVFLSVATFFEGYDFLALAQLLPELRAEFGLDVSQAGLLVTVANLGTVVAFLVVRQADRLGRRAVLAATILGYTLCSLLSAAAPDAWTFGVAQFFARIFLIGEWVIAMVYAAEEFPADRRGFIIGIIQACTSLGAVACAALVPTLVSLPLGWRTVYVVGAVPLLIVAWLRRNVQETRRFQEAGAREGGLFDIWKTPYRGRVIQLAIIWGLTYLCSQTIITFWKEFAMEERGFTAAEVGGAISVAALVAMPMAFAVGKVLDVVGRRAGAVFVFLTIAAGGFGSYTFHDPVALRIALIGAMFGASAVLPVLNAWSTELFPTALRSDAFAWSNNLLGRTTYVLAPVVVSFAATSTGWGPAVAATAIGPVLALGLILLWMPETRGAELEQTSQV